MINFNMSGDRSTRRVTPGISPFRGAHLFIDSRLGRCGLVFRLGFESQPAIAVFTSRQRAIETARGIAAQHGVQVWMHVSDEQGQPHPAVLVFDPLQVDPETFNQSKH